MAAGVTLRKDALSAFRAYLEAALASAVEAARRDDALLIDGALTAAAASNDMVATIARAGPFGAGNPEPVIALPAHTLVYVEEVGQAHMRVRLRAGDGSTLNAIAFRAAGQKLGSALAREPRALRACGRHFVPRPLERRRAGAAAPDRYGPGRYGVARVARMERSEIRGVFPRRENPGFRFAPGLRFAAGHS